METEKRKPTFEEAFQQLEELTQRLEEGGLPLEEMVSLYERGMELANLCLTMLEEAELRVKKLTPLPRGGYEARPFDEGEGQELSF